MRLFVVGFRASVILGLLMIANSTFGQIPITTPRADDYSSLKSPSSKRAAAKTTIVEFELLQESDGGGLYSQHWLKVLGPLDIPLRVHRPLLDDKPELKERQVGNLRYVTAIGALDRSGAITFPGKTFAVGDATKLKEWIEELRTYGAKGTPTNQPLWGLAKDQFSTIYESLTKPVEFETEDMPLDQMIAKLPLPQQYPLHWSVDATRMAPRQGSRPNVRLELKGLCAATALAIALNEKGLGFRPNRTPNNEIELLVEPRPSKQELWPIGWPVQLPMPKAAPKLFAMVAVELTDEVLADVINAISKLSETPVLIDYAELDAKKIDLEKIKISFPRKMTNWNIALNKMVVPQRLTQEIWQDEAGHVFVWITTTRAGRTTEPGKSAAQ